MLFAFMVILSMGKDLNVRVKRNLCPVHKILGKFLVPEIDCEV